MTLTDQDIIAQQGRKEKAAHMRVVWVGFTAAAVFAGIALMEENGLFDRLGLPPNFSMVLIIAAAAVSIVVATFFFWKAKFSPEGDERILKLRLDEFQGQQRRVLFAMTILFAAFSVFTVVRPLLHVRDTTIEFDFSVEYALIALAAAAALSFGPGFMRRRYRIAADDEFVRQLRGRATQFGYIIAVGALAVSYLIGQFRPDWLRIALPAALFVGVVLPAIRFLLADRRAAASDE